MKSRVYQPAEDSKLIANQINKTFQDKKILDLGTGSGILSIECTKFTKDITAIDINTNALKHTKSEIKNKIIKLTNKLNKRIKNTNITQRVRKENQIKNRINNLKNIKVIESDSFKNIKFEKYDIILYNSPYLPNEPKDPDIALDGGEKGYEIPLETIKECKDHLNKNGKIVTIISSKSEPEFQLEEIKKMKYNIKIKEKQTIFFEELTIIELELKENLN